MKREPHVRFCERAAVKLRRATHLVICCRPGQAETAMKRMTVLMNRLGLEVNETKTRIARLPTERFTFLGYTIGRFYGKDGQAFIGTRPSKKAVLRLLRRIHERTTPRWYRTHRRIPSPSSVAFFAAGAVTSTKDLS
jgi:hypothetical protein